MVQQNINAQAPLKFSIKIKIKIIKRYKYPRYATVNLIPGQTHYTKNDSRALERVLRENMEIVGGLTPDRPKAWLDAGSKYDLIRPYRIRLGPVQLNSGAPSWQGRS